MTKRNSIHRLACVCLAATVILAATVASAADLIKPRIAVNLPEKHNTPDGMTLDPAGNIILACPNFGDNSHPAMLMKISRKGELSEFFKMPLHPETKMACPLGIGFGSDGNLYVADCQAIAGEKDYKSRLLRVRIEDGKAVGCDVVVTGFIMSNAVAAKGDSIYVTETEIDGSVTPMSSGVYRFKLSELTGEPIKLLPGGKDKHLIATLYTKNEEFKVGANGLGFDAAGNMFVCNFGDAAINKITFKPSGEVDTNKVFAQGQGMRCCDGLKIDQKTGDIYVADFLGNAVHRIDAAGKVTTLAKNGDTDGSGGLLDKPSEVCLRGAKLYIANIDLPLDGNTYDAPHTISVIVVKKIKQKK
ncbi:MAG: SMP-30/gluconolactonase/LRE family protein [Candidatus Nealsonbacteria bacterium]|nr:SMP-30/gluconolactonase/LRE family protein [Candidatus Nealsonbacteria bacterium]